MSKGTISPAINQAAWFNQNGADGTPLTPADIIATNLSPLASDANNKRNSEGLVKKEQIWQDPNLYIAYPSGRAFTNTVIGKVAQQKWSKGPGDQAGEWGGFDFYDVQDGNDWKVYMDTPVHIEARTKYYYPTNGGKYEYAVSSFQTNVTAIQAKIIAKNAEAAAIAAAAAAAAGAGGGANAGNPYVYMPTGGIVPPAQPAMSRAGRELTLPDGPDGPIWYALTPEQSAAQNGPHPGIALAGPMVWNPEWGTPEENGLPPGIRLVTMDITPGEAPDLNTIGPSGDTLKIVMARAQSGDRTAASILGKLKIPKPRQNLGGILRGLF